MQKTFTGDKKIFEDIRNFLIKKGFNILQTDAVHTGNNVYEFEESFSGRGLGIHEIRKVKAYIKDGEVRYKSENLGWIVSD